MAFVISKNCYKCGGSGIWIKTTVGGHVPVNPCPVCQGSGLLPMYSVELDQIVDKVDDLIDKLNDVKEKCDEIMEKLNE
jgi:DnaJ-class molecular chaperone